jgi:hypothetical protein
LELLLHVSVVVILGNPIQVPLRVLEQEVVVRLDRE